MKTGALFISQAEMEHFLQAEMKHFLQAEMGHFRKAEMKQFLLIKHIRFNNKNKIFH